MADRINALRVSLGLAVLLVEQNLDFICAMADRALLIQRGRIVVRPLETPSTIPRSSQSSSK